MTAYTNGACTCVTCRSHRFATNAAFVLRMLGPPFDVIEGPYRPPVEHIAREQAERERNAQRQARTAARRALRSVAGRRGREATAALSMRASALRRVA